MHRDDCTHCCLMEIKLHDNTPLLKDLKKVCHVLRGTGFRRTRKLYDELPPTLELNYPYSYFKALVRKLVMDRGYITGWGPWIALTRRGKAWAEGRVFHE